MCKHTTGVPLYLLAITALFLGFESQSSQAQGRPDLLRLTPEQLEQLGEKDLAAPVSSASPASKRARAIARKRKVLPRVPRRLRRALGFSGRRFSTDYRTINGQQNNRSNPRAGSAGIPFERMAEPSYGDGAGAPNDENLPNVRSVSNSCIDQLEARPSGLAVTDFVWQWGQFLDHDITHTPTMEPAELFMIEIPSGDRFFDPRGTGEKQMKFERSAYQMIGGVRQQMNAITAYVDASNVYGSDSKLAAELRTLDGSGQLKVSEGNYLPLNVNGFHNAPTSHDPTLFLAGDFRANEQVALTAMHTLFVREHNYWARHIKRAFPWYDGERTYQLARAIVSAEMQVITYNEFLPRLVGENGLSKYRGYDSSVNPNISNEFATAAFRFGHSMLSSHLLRVDEGYRPTEFGPLLLRDAFFQPKRLVEEGGIEPVLRGLSFQHAQEIDLKIIDDVRNFLFGRPGSGGFDLASLNIQRARDHGLASFNDLRRAANLAPATSFADVTSSPELQSCLEETYGSIEQLDLWVGGLAEDHVKGAMLGETFAYILTDQFERLRDGDRFWYESYLPRKMVKMIRKQTLAKVIRRNTTIGRELQPNVFKMRKDQK